MPTPSRYRHDVIPLSGRTGAVGTTPSISTRQPGVIALGYDKPTSGVLLVSPARLVLALPISVSGVPSSLVFTLILAYCLEILFHPSATFSRDVGAVVALPLAVVFPQAFLVGVVIGDVVRPLVTRRAPAFFGAPLLVFSTDNITATLRAGVRLYHINSYPSWSRPRWIAVHAGVFLQDREASQIEAVSVYIEYQESRVAVAARRLPVVVRTVVERRSAERPPLPTGYRVAARHVCAK